jgi:hypothetical protein
MLIPVHHHGQGLPELDQIARVAAEAAGWDAARTRQEAAAYAAAVRRRYQIVAPAIAVPATRALRASAA